jgi:RND superfamily putative drug exporter
VSVSLAFRSAASAAVSEPSPTAASILAVASVLRAALKPALRAVVVLPSAMKLLDRWNWYLPRWLEWLPRLQVERAPSAAPPQPAP